jgi:DNA polymerase III delta prime subunit
MTKKQTVSNHFTPFIEKYRPRRVGDIFGQPHLHETLRDVVEKGKQDGKFLNALYIGPKGVGKTSTAYVVAREILGPEWRQNFLEINVPLIENIQNFIEKDLTRFVSSKPLNGVPFKVVFFDECEHLPAKDQSKLKKIIEDSKYKYARYIFATNYSASNLDALCGGRVLIYHFKKISDPILKDYLNCICAKEGIHSDKYQEGLEEEDDITLDPILDMIVEVADGCLREGLSLLDDLTGANKIIPLQKARYRLAYIEPESVEKLLKKALQNQDYMKYFTEEILALNLSIPKLLDKIVNVIDNLLIDSQEKRYIIDQLGKYSFRINQGTDQTLQFKCFLNAIASIHDNHAIIQEV